jgi:hypothetical protein
MTQPPPYRSGGAHAGAPTAHTTEFGPTTTVTSTPPAPNGGAAVGHAPAFAPPPGPDHGGAPSANPAAPKPPRVRGPRRARLQLRHVNPWTVLKFSCVLSIALFFIWMLVIAILFGILDAAGVISKVNDTITTINGPGSKAPVTGGIVLGGAAIVGVINVILFIALSTVGSVIYNLCADLVGGVELTLSEA